jgi:CheY-like chemotaxis protein
MPALRVPTLPAPSRSGRRPSAWPDLSHVTVAVVEDVVDARFLISDVLRHCGAAVVTYESGEAAIKDVSASFPSLFVCDLAMPGASGLGFMRRVRAIGPERGGAVPAVAISAFYEAASEAGYSAYLSKPVDIDALCRLVSDLARRAA